MFRSLIHDFHVDIFNSPELRVRVEKHLFLETSRDSTTSAGSEWNPAVENKLSHMFDVGTMKRKSNAKNHSRNHVSTCQGSQFGNLELTLVPKLAILDSL